MKKLIALPILFLFALSCKQSDVHPIKFEIDLFEQTFTHNKSITLTREGEVFFMDESLESLAQVKTFKLTEAEVKEINTKLKNLPHEECTPSNLPAVSEKTVYILHVKGTEDWIYKGYETCNNFKVVDDFVIFLFNFIEKHEGRNLFKQRNKEIALKLIPIEKVSDFRFIPEEKMTSVKESYAKKLGIKTEPLIVMAETIKTNSNQKSQSFVVFYSDNRIFKYCMVTDAHDRNPQIRNAEVIDVAQKKELLTVLGRIEGIQKTLHYVSWPKSDKWISMKEAPYYILGVYKEDAYAQYKVQDISYYRAEPDNNYGYREIKEMKAIVGKLDFYNELFK